MSTLRSTNSGVTITVAAAPYGGAQIAIGLLDGQTVIGLSRDEAEHLYGRLGRILQRDVSPSEYSVRVDR
jgi:hypothetical protein